MFKRVLNHVLTSNKVVEEQECWKRRRTERESDSDTSRLTTQSQSHRHHKRHSRHRHRRDRSHSPPSTATATASSSSIGNTCLNRSRVVNYCTPFLDEQVVNVGSGSRSGDRSGERSRPPREKQRPHSSAADNIDDDEDSAVRAWNAQLQGNTSASSKKRTSARTLPPLERTGLEANRWDHAGFDTLEKDPHRH